MNLTKFNRRPFFAEFMTDFDKNFLNNQAVCQHDVPAVNIKEEEKQFIIEMAAPGLKKDDFKINLDNQMLTISREQEEKKEEVKENYSRREFGFSKFSRSFRLPKTIIGDKIKAEYNDGILSLKLPKDEKAILTREISVN